MQMLVLIQNSWMIHSHTRSILIKTTAAQRLKYEN